MNLTDDLRDLITSMISTSPDATIAVKSTYKKTVTENINFYTKPNSNLKVKQTGVPDLKTCQYYFMSNISATLGGNP